MTKKKRLDKIEELTEMAMIKFLEEGNYEMLPALATPANWLAKNQKVAEKEKSTLEEEIKKRVKEAEERRANGKV